MDCIILDRKISISEKDQILSLSSKTEVLSTSSIFMESDLKSDLIPSISESEKKEINYNILEDLLSFPSISFNGTSIIDYLTEGSFNVWFYHKFRLYFDIRNSYYDIQRILHIKPHYEQVTIFTSNIILANFSEFQDQTRIILKEPSQKINKLSVFNFVLTSGLRLIKGLLKINSRNNRKVIIDSRGNYKMTTDLLADSKKIENFYLGSLYSEEHIEGTTIIDVLPIPKLTIDDTFKFDLHNIFSPDKNHRIYEEAILFKSLLSKTDKRMKKKVSDSVQTKLNTITDNLNLSPIHQLFLWRLKHLSKSTNLYLFKHLAYKRYFKNAKHQALIGIDEYSANNKLIHDAAKINGMTSIGIQHGTMHELHPGYVYSKSEAATNPFPNQMIIWGDRWKKFLAEKGNFPLQSLKISGQLRTDKIGSLLSSKDKLKSKIEISKRILLFASQPQRDQKLREQMVEDVMSAVKNIDTIELIIKPHPLEQNLNFFKSIGSRLKYHSFRIEPQIDLYQLLAMSDYVITSFSTVGTEAVYFKKPLIIYDPLMQDLMQYVADGVGLQAKNSQEILECLQGLESRKNLISEITQSEFIEKNAFQIDGEVTQRTMKIINNSSEN